MFEKNYKNAMDSITPTNDTKEKILDKLELKQELKRHKNPAMPWRVAFACVACVAVVLGMLFIPRDTKQQDENKPFAPTLPKQSTSTQLLVSSKTYDEVYKIIKENNKYRDENGYLNYEDEVIADGMAMPSAPDSAPSTNGDTDTNKSESDPKDFSNTTEQVEGVSEADVVKTDGKHIYYLMGNELTIFKADGQNSAFVSKIFVKENEKYHSGYGDMFLKQDRVVILYADYSGDNAAVEIIIYDVSDPANPQKVSSVCQQGHYNSVRMVGDYIYLISNYHINPNAADLDAPLTFVPYTTVDNTCFVFPADKIYYYEQENYHNQYTVIGAYNYKDGTLKDSASLLGGTDNIYCSQGNIILADTRYCGDSQEETYISEKTIVSKLAISEGNIEYKVSGEVYGTLENQFNIDEHNGYFRFVTTATTIIQTTYEFENREDTVVSYTRETAARLTVLDSELNMVSEIADLAKGERVYSVRFMGDMAYFVTFRQTDPLFSADLSDPANPKILGELKIPGFSEYMYPYGEGLLLGFGMDADENGRTTYLKLSMFDITNPSDVTEQDKTIIDGYHYSNALDNHKSMLVSPDKNLIGFAAMDNRGFVVYMVYEHKDGGFNCKAKLQLLDDYVSFKFWDDVRGVFIDDEFYLLSHKGLQVFEMNEFSQIAAVEI